MKDELESCNHLSGVEYMTVTDVPLHCLLINSEH